MAKKTDRPGWVRILAVFAHPDDEIFCAGGTLARYAAQGAEVMVVSATQGEAGQIHDACAATRRTLGQTRARELQLSCRRLGVQQAICLDYGDGRLRDNDPLPLIECLTGIIRTFRPDIVITFGPDGAYGHPDHVTISELTTRAFYLAGDSTQFPEQLKDGGAPHRPGRLYYSAFPRNRRLLADQLVAWLVESEPSAASPCGGGNDGGSRTIEFAHALKIFAEEATMLGYSSDNVAIQWFPQGFYIVEQGEPATKPYLILSGQAEVIYEAEDGTLCLRQQLGPGQFFGELGLAHQQPRAAHVVASQSVTCMVLSPHVASNYEGRGAAAALAGAAAAGSLPQETEPRITTKIDVSKFIEQKVTALTAHRTQFPLEPAMLPRSMLQELMGYEYFVKVHPPAALESGFVVMSEIMKLRYEQDSNGVAHFI